MLFDKISFCISSVSHTKYVILMHTTYVYIKLHIKRYSNHVNSHVVVLWIIISDMTFNSVQTCHVEKKYLLSMAWFMYGILFLHFHLPRMFLCTEVLFEKLIGQVNKDILYHIFIYQTNDNQQGCSRLSNWFSLRCLGPWMNYLPPVWWSTFRFSFLNKCWCVRVVQWRGILHWFAALSLFLYITKVFPSIFLANYFTLK